MGVYLLRCMGTDFVKIGYAADVAERLTTLQAGCPFELGILAWNADGSFDDERRIHHRFIGSHVRREWYTMADGMIEAVASSASGVKPPKKTKRQRRAEFIATLKAQSE